MGKKVNKLFQKTKKTFFPTGKQVATLQKLRPTADNYETVASFDLVSCQLLRFWHFWPTRAFWVNGHLEHILAAGLIFKGLNSIHDTFTSTSTYFTLTYFYQASKISYLVSLLAFQLCD